MGYCGGKGRNTARTATHPLHAVHHKRADIFPTNILHPWTCRFPLRYKSTVVLAIELGPGRPGVRSFSRCRRGKVAFGAAQVGEVVAAGEESLDIACRLAQALAVFDQGDANEAFAIFAETDPGRHRNIGPLEQ